MKLPNPNCHLSPNSNTNSTKLSQRTESPRNNKTINHPILFIQPSCLRRSYRSLNKVTFTSNLQHLQLNKMSAAETRVKKEIIALCKEDTTSNIIVFVCGDDERVPSKPGWRHLTGSIPGPGSTVYEGGRFEVDILIPKGYPFEPPKMKFNTKIWHPNVSSQTGAICLVRQDNMNDVILLLLLCYE